MKPGMGTFIAEAAEDVPVAEELPDLVPVAEAEARELVVAAARKRSLDW
jgi:hypothetical protein